MHSSEPQGLPARPAHVGEWEDLLVRFELMTRALRNLIDESGDSAGEMAAELQRLSAREEEALSFLYGLAEENARGAVPAPEEPGELPTDVEALRYRFTRARSRSFAAVQRRGLEVWDWAGDHPRYGQVSVFQLLRMLVREDGRTLSALRQVLQKGAPAC